jgi:sugar lactone lactonase YvrE
MLIGVGIPLKITGVSQQQVKQQQKPTVQQQTVKQAQRPRISRGKRPTPAKVESVLDVVVDNAGDLYILDINNFCVWRLDKEGKAVRVAGGGNPAEGNGDDGPATEAWFEYPNSITLDGSGNLYISDHVEHRVRRVDRRGVITTVAGTGEPGFSGDGGPGSDASLNNPTGIATDSEGCLYIADSNNSRVRKVNTDGIITTVVGSGKYPRINYNGGLASDAELLSPTTLTIDSSGNMYIGDGTQVWKVERMGIVRRVAGFREFQAGQTPVLPKDLAIDEAGNVYIADYSTQSILKLDPDGVLTTVVARVSGSENAKHLTVSDLQSPNSVAIDKEGLLLVAGGNKLMRIDLRERKVHQVILPRLSSPQSRGEGISRPPALIRWAAGRRPGDAGADRDVHWPAERSSAAFIGT